MSHNRWVTPPFFFYRRNVRQNFVCADIKCGKGEEKTRTTRIGYIRKRVVYTAMWIGYIRRRVVYTAMCQVGGHVECKIRCKRTITMTNGDTPWGFTQSSTWRSGLPISPLVISLWSIKNPRCSWDRSTEPHYTESVECSDEGGQVVDRSTWRKSGHDVHQTTYTWRLYMKSVVCRLTVPQYRLLISSYW